MTEDGYEWGSGGRERFTRDFGVIETIERITVEDNACSRKTKKTVTIKRKPGASPLLFGKYLMDHCAFIGLEDISDGLPSYREEVVPVAMEEPLKSAYEELEEEITACLKEHRGNSSVASTMLNALLAWPDHPYGFGTLYGSEFNPETKMPGIVCHRRNGRSGQERDLCQRAGADRRGQSPARAWPQVPGLCGLHQQARRHRTAGTSVSQQREFELRYCGPAFLLTGGKPGTASSCAEESMSQSAIPRSSKPGSICWTFRPSCFMRLATRCTRYDSPAAGHGVSDKDAPWR